jgi:hypothetical protein
VKSSKYLDDLKNAKLLQSANLLLTHCTNTWKKSFRIKC